MTLSEPQVTVAAIITRIKDGVLHILLTRRSSSLSHFPGAWVIPGGHVELYESREQAIIREVKEETGLHFHPTLFGVYDEIIQAREIHAVVSVYKGPGDGELLADPHEVSEIGWFALDTVLASDLEFGFEHKQILQDFAKLA